MLRRLALIVAGLTLGLPASASAADPVLAAAGDIACSPINPAFNGGQGTSDACRQMATSSLALAQQPSAVAVLGDNQYDSGSLLEYETSFGPSWGRLKASIRPVAGNHEYRDPSALGYFDYFGAAAGPDRRGYYSYDLGAWHIVALNSNCSETGCVEDTQGRVSTAEVNWLASDLQAHPGRCTLAYWHHPRFSSDSRVGSSPGTAPLWELLHSRRADLVLSGHAHDYERFRPLSAAGSVSTAARGLTEMVVGTGGEDHHQFLPGSLPGSVVRDPIHFGVLFLALHGDSYDWRWVREDGVVGDRGSASCHSDRTRPRVTVSSPRPGARLRTGRPQIKGGAGIATGDRSRVKVTFTARGGRRRPASVTVRSRSGRWSARPSRGLSAGTWAVRASQADEQGNVGRSKPWRLVIAARR